MHAKCAPQFDQIPHSEDLDEESRLADQQNVTEEMVKSMLVRGAVESHMSKEVYQVLDAFMDTLADDPTNCDLKQFEEQISDLHAQYAPQFDQIPHSEDLDEESRIADQQNVNRELAYFML